MKALTDNTCILLATFKSYRPVATVTHKLLANYWPDHPPLFVAGVTELDGATCLTTTSDVREWTGVVADACDQLSDLGFSSVYLVLDDHPPLNSCHSIHLNDTIPHLLTALDATYIGLNGWGYGRPGRHVNGQLLSHKDWKLERVQANFTWKGSLHPGLWSVTRLGRFARLIQENYPPDRRTAWAFERLVGQDDLVVDFDCNNSFYRVCGRRMTASQSRYIRYRAAFAGASLLEKMLNRAIVAPASLTRSARVLGHYYEGPYPLFWSGIISQGRLNPVFASYARAYRRRDLRPLILNALSDWDPSTIPKNNR